MAVATKKKNCKKGYPCGDSCINKQLNCSDPLEGQAKTFADWLKSQGGQQNNSKQVGKKVKSSNIKVSNPNFEITTDKREIKKLYKKQWQNLVDKMIGASEEIELVDAEKKDYLFDKEKIEKVLASRKNPDVKLGVFIPKTPNIRNIRRASEKELNQEITFLDKEIKKLEDKQLKLQQKRKQEFKKLGTGGFSFERVESAGFILDTLGKELDQSGNKFIGVKDVKGNLQGLIMYESKSKEIEVDYLASAPWNVIKTHQNYTRGAGSSAIEAAILLSEQKNKKGAISLSALPDAVPFYQKIGFKTVSGTEKGEIPEMKLSSDKAKDFLNSRRSRTYSELSLDDLEEKAGLILTIPKKGGKMFIEELDFATKKTSKKKKKCKKGFPCGGSCIARNRNCRSPLKGQAKNYSSWLKMQTKKQSSSTVKPKTTKKSSSSSSLTTVSAVADSKAGRRNQFKGLSDSSREIISVAKRGDNTLVGGQLTSNTNNSLRFDSLTRSGIPVRNSLNNSVRELEEKGFATVTRSSKTGKITRVDLIEDIKKFEDA